MAFINSGSAVPTIVSLEQTSLGARTNLRPNEVTGSYRFSGTSSSISFGSAGWSSANLPVFSFNYTGTKTCVVRSVTAQYNITTATTGGNAVPISLYIVRSWATQGSTGALIFASSLTPKKRSSFGSPSNAIRITDGTAGGITGDSVTEDAVRYSQLLLSTSGVGPAPQDNPRDFLNNSMQNASYVAHPLVFAQYEGFRIKTDMPYWIGSVSSGTGTLTIAMEYEETAGTSTSY
jgi:hypothetical protein